MFEILRGPYIFSQLCLIGFHRLAYRQIMTLSRQCSSNCRLASKLPNSEDDTRQLKPWTQIAGPVAGTTRGNVPYCCVSH